MSENERQLFEIAVTNKETDEILVDVTTVMASSKQTAHNMAVKKVVLQDAEVDLSEIDVKVRSFD